MIARIRGDHDARSGRWRPSTPSQNAAAATGRPAAVAVPPGACRVRARPRAGRWLILLAIAAVAYVAVRAALSARLPQPWLPATPRAWLDAYEGAAIDNPGRVCSELFAPRLARAYGRAAHGTCVSYFQRITSSSVRVGRVMRDGQTAVLDLEQKLPPRRWAVVLSRRSGGWQAVDLVAAHLVG